MRKRLVGTDHHNDEQFFDLSRDARFLYGHLLSHPLMTSFGLIRLTVGGLADECGMTRDECRAALDELAALGRVEIGRRCLALSEDYLESPANPSVVTGWGKIIELLPRTELVRRRLRLAYDLVKERAAAKGEKGSTWAAAIPDSLREVLTTAPAPVGDGRSPHPPDTYSGPPRPASGRGGARKRAVAKSATVARFPVAAVGGSATTEPQALATASLAALATAPVVETVTLTTAETLTVDPATITLEVDDTTDDGGELLDAAELFALVEVDDAPADEPIDEPEPLPPAAEVVESPYSLPTVGLVPSPAESTLFARPEPVVKDGVEDRAEDDVAEGVEDGVEHGARHGVEHGVGHSVYEGLRHRAGHGVLDGPRHSFFHLPAIQLPFSRRGRLAPERAGAREADDDGFEQLEIPHDLPEPEAVEVEADGGVEDGDLGFELDLEVDDEPEIAEPGPDGDPPTFEPDPDLDPDLEHHFRGLAEKAEGVLGRTLEVDERTMLRTWVGDVPIQLIEQALADGLRSRIHRLAWVGKRLETLIAGHLAKHPELADDDLDEERRDALAALDNDEMAGHLSEVTREVARGAIRRATSARQVRDILDQAFES